MVLNRRALIILLCLFPACVGFGDDSGFRTIVGPFFETHCVDCHGAEEPEGEFALHELTGGSKVVSDIERWEQILEKLVLGEMPPDEEEQPKQIDRARAIAWIKTTLRNSGHASEWDRKLLFPGYGNYIDHDQLFDPTGHVAAWSPSRLWKRSPYIFDSLIVRGIGLGKGRSGRPPGSLAKVKQPFTIEDKAGDKDFAAIMYADSATLATMLRNAEVIVDKHIEGALHELDVQRNGPTPEDQLPKDKRGKPIRPRYAKTASEFSDVILSEKAPSDVQVDDAVRKMFDLVVEQEPSVEEVGKYRGLIRECIGKAGNAEGLRVGLVAIAISPPAIYRAELGQGSEDQHGRRMLGPVELAHAIAYGLTDSKPDDELLKAAKPGRLSTRDDVTREVVRLWDDDSIDKPRIMRFFHEFFGYHKAPKVFKDSARFGGDYRGVAESLVADADVLVKHIVKLDQDVLVELLTTEEYFVAHSGDNDHERDFAEQLEKFYAYFKDKPWRDFPYQTPKEHAEFARSLGRAFSHPNGNVVKGWMRYLTKCHENGVTPINRPRGRQFISLYNLAEETFDYPVSQPFVLAKGKRAGLLMHPAWLLAHSVNLDNDPVRRGKWVRERLLAGTVPEVPITLDARVPDAPDQSLRERFVVTHEQECWRCHSRMNPLGMPFELFDDFGRHRAVEVLHVKGKTKPVDSTGILDGTGDVSLEGDVHDPIEMVQRLAKSKRVRQSFVRHAFRYWLGRNEMFSDSATLVAANQAYTENGGSFRALVVSLMTSDSFLYRKQIGAE